MAPFSSTVLKTKIWALGVLEPDFLIHSLQLFTKPELENLCSRFTFPSLWPFQTSFSNGQQRAQEKALVFLASQVTTQQVKERRRGLHSAQRNCQILAWAGRVSYPVGSCHVRVRGQLSTAQVPQGEKVPPPSSGGLADWWRRIQKGSTSEAGP